MKPAYYNEIDQFAAQWLRNLITAGHIAPGDIDERSIEDVHPSDLKPYTQCHFFAGIGVWSHALRRAGWPDDRSVWTGSCPCQPFSAAGEGAGFDDERHLWPHFFHLIEQRKPPAIFGEQVASKDADPWIDLVQADMEAVGYSFGAVPFPSAGIGAPHIRDRLYWMGHASGTRLERHARNGGAKGWQGPNGSVAAAGISGGLANSNQYGFPALPLDRCDDTQHHAEPRGELVGMGNPNGERTGRDGRVVCCALDRQDRQYSADHADTPVSDGGMANPKHDGHGGPESHSPEPHRNREDFWLSDGGHIAPQGQPAAGPTNGHWSAADWLLCRDGKWRTVEPGTQPLVNGAPARVGRLRAYGNAINAEAARVFIEAAMSCMP